MAEENGKVTDVKEPLTTDADLTSVYDDAMKAETEVKEEAKPAEEAKPVVEGEVVLTHEEEARELHKTRSDLGRKFKGLEDKYDLILNEIRGLKPKPEEQPLPEVITTPEDVNRVIDAREQGKSKKVQEYQGTYTRTFQELGEDDLELHEEVMKEVFPPDKPQDYVSPFNKIISGDPVRDAAKNYKAAMKAVLAKKTANVKPPEPQPNVRGEKPVGSGVSVGTKTIPSGKPKVQLDDLTKSFLRVAERDEAWAQKALES